MIGGKHADKFLRKEKQTAEAMELQLAALQPEEEKYARKQLTSIIYVI